MLALGQFIFGLALREIFLAFRLESFFGSAVGDYFFWLGALRVFFLAWRLKS